MFDSIRPAALASRVAREKKEKKKWRRFIEFAIWISVDKSDYNGG